VGALQILQAIGSVLGALSAAFLVYDRAVRGRPTFELDVEPGLTPSSEKYPCARIVNVLDEALIVENFSVVPPIVGLAEDHSIGATMAAQIKKVRTLVLPARGAATYGLVILGAATGRDSDQIVISAEWRATRSIRPWKRTVRIRTTVAELKSLKAARTIGPS
jgi:hypothetical protein